MPIPSPIPTTVVLDTIREIFHINASVITYVRGAESTLHYNLAGPSGAYRLKVYSSDKELDSRLEATFYMNYALGITGVVAPIMKPDKSGTTFMLADRKAALFPYIFVTPPVNPSRINNAEGELLGRLIGRVHTTRLSRIRLPDGDFSTQKADTMADILKLMPAAIDDSRRYLRQSLATVILPAADPIEIEIDTLRSSAALAQKAHLKRVVSHSAPIAKNTLSGSEVYLVNWEEAQMASREMDLMHFHDDDAVLRGYMKETGESSLNMSAIRYYRSLWNLRTIIRYSQNILYGNSTQTQHNHTLTLLQNFLRDNGFQK